jgi:hypothetical protein
MVAEVRGSWIDMVACTPLLARDGFIATVPFTIYSEDSVETILTVSINVLCGTA